MTSGNLNHEYGFTLVRAGDPAKARQVFHQALPTIKPAALRSLALLDLYQGKYRDARSNLQEALPVLNSIGIRPPVIDRALNCVFRQTFSIRPLGEFDKLVIRREAESDDLADVQSRIE
jgi:hypothetical protein